MALFGICFPSTLWQHQFIIAIGMIVLIGIPHGATDYIIFQNLSKPFWGTDSLFYFYRNYILIMGAYALLWWFSPMLSLVLFLGLSIYHFGQSNWNFLEDASKTVKLSLYLVWGSFVLLAPILIRYEEAMPILEQILGFAPVVIEQNWRYAAVLFLFAHSVYVCFYLRTEGYINKKQFQDEILNLSLLLAVYLATPLLLGFAIYFVFWHSLGSVMDQITFFKKNISGYTWKKYIKHAFPLTIAALGTLGAMIWLQQSTGIHANIGAMFIFISVVTLPHMLLIDRLYEEWDTGRIEHFEKEYQS
jgi:Brp/Blh family beta-carotene 15,15'-monooxygenase